MSTDCLAARHKKRAKVVVPEKQEPSKAEISSGREAEDNSPGDGEGGYSSSIITQFQTDIAAEPEIFEPLRLEFEKAGYNLQDIGLPPAVPPDPDFSQILHTLVTAYTNVLHGWIEVGKAAGSIKQRQWVSDDSGLSADQHLDVYLDLQDPLLRSSLVHLLNIIYTKKVPLSDNELSYLKMRLRWIEKALLLPGMKGIDWKEEYPVLYEESLSWGGAGFNIPVAETTNALIQELKEGNYADSSYLAGEYLTVSDHPTELRMETVWQTWFQFGESGMGCDGDGIKDILLVHHAQYLLKALMHNTKLSSAKKILGLAWLQQTAIERNLAEKTQQEEWRLLLNDKKALPPADESDDVFLPSTPGKRSKSKVSNASRNMSLAESERGRRTSMKSARRTSMAIPRPGRDNTPPSVSSSVSSPRTPNSTAIPQVLVMSSPPKQAAPLSEPITVYYGFGGFATQPAAVLSPVIGYGYRAACIHNCAGGCRTSLSSVVRGTHQNNSAGSMFSGTDFSLAPYVFSFHQPNK